MSLQQVTLQLDGAELDLPELDGIAAGYHVLQALALRDRARRIPGRPSYLAMTEAHLWRRITELLEKQGLLEIEA